MDGQDPERTASLFHDVVGAIDRGNFGLLASYMRRRAPAVVYWKNEGYATVRSLLKRHIEPVREAVHPPSVPSAKSSPSAELRIAVAVERVLLLRLATKFVHPDVAHPEVLEPDANRALDACVIAYRTAKLELDCLEKHFGAHETAAGKGEDTAPPPCLPPHAPLPGLVHTLRVCACSYRGEDCVSRLHDTFVG